MTPNIKNAIILLAGFFLVCILSQNKANGQSTWEAGIRVGDKFSIEGTIPIAASPRLQPAIYISDLGGQSYGDFGLAAYFDWMFALENGPRGLKFFPGVGPEFFFGNDFHFVIAGNFGVEYAFDFPLTIAFDWRPGFVTTDSFSFYSQNAGVSARFRFGDRVRFRRVN